MLANLCRPVKTYAPGIVDDIGNTEEGSRPSQGSHDTWGDGSLEMKQGSLAGAGWLMDALVNAYGICLARNLKGFLASGSD